MRAKNPAMAEGGKKKFVMKPPQVVRIGTKKTSFVNFADICRILHRQPKHLLAFLLAELGTRYTAFVTCTIALSKITLIYSVHCFLSFVIEWSNRLEKFLHIEIQCSDINNKTKF